MTPELAQWIPPAVIIGVMLYLHRHHAPGHEANGVSLVWEQSTAWSRRSRISATVWTRRTGTFGTAWVGIEGTLDVLREFLVGAGRGTAA